MALFVDWANIYFFNKKNNLAKLGTQDWFFGRLFGV